MISHQPSLPFKELACSSCPYSIIGRCMGPNAGSITPPTKNVIGCFNTGKIVSRFDNISRRLLRQTEGCSINRLPPVILEGIRLKETFEIPPRPLFAVSLNTLLTKAGNVRYSGDPIQLREKLRLRSDARLILLGTGGDRRLEKFWSSAERKSKWEQLRSFGFDLATTFTFSVWGNDPRFDQIYNQDRNYATYDLITSWGLPTIPFLFCATREDYDAATAWLSSHSYISTIAVLAQFYSRGKAFDNFMLDVDDFLLRVDRPLQLVVVGVSSLTRIRDLQNRYGAENVSIVTTQPIYKAMKGQISDPQLRFQNGYPLRPEALIESNIRTFDRAVAGVSF